jgi:subtilisin family serine protease
MKRCIWSFAVLIGMMWGTPASAQISLGGLVSNLTQTVSGVLSGNSQGVIVRTNLGLSGLQNACLVKGCTVTGSIDGGLNQVFLVKPVQGLLPNLLAGVLRLVNGILGAEVDQSVAIPTAPSNQAQAANPPAGLWDSTPVNYYGTTVPNGYVNQPAAQIIRIAQAHSVFNVTGSGIIADIDTGVDPNHPALQGVLLQGYDFTRNQPGGSEMTDVANSTSSSCDSPSSDCQAVYVNQHTVAMLDQHTAAMLDQHTAAMVDGTQYAAFGHGTMVAGILHLTAPTAKILPLKSFHADGSANLSDILRAIYYAVQNNAKVINMSFNLTSPSAELNNAIAFAANNNVISVASSGNDGKQEIVYPAATKNVMGAASTSDSDQRSTFSNYGNQVVWVAAPGEAIVTTYPFGFYAAGWGTSFSSPFVAGTASLVANMTPTSNQTVAAWAIGHAKYIGPNMGNGRLDVYSTLSAVNPVRSILH